MPTAVWFALKRSLNCKTDPSKVSDPNHNPNKSHHHSRSSCGCSRSILMSSLRDVVNGASRRHVDRPQTCSPRSMASSEFMNPITHEVVFDNSSKCEIKILGINSGGKLRPSGSICSGFMGTLRPGTPGPRGQFLVPGSPGYDRGARWRQSIGTPPRKSGGRSVMFGGSRSFRKTKGFPGVGSKSIGGNISVLVCQKCGEEFKKLDAVEAHHLSQHAVTELTEGDSSRMIVEMICQARGIKSETGTGKIDRVLKVHNMQRTLARFEEYREMVKIRASKLSKKHPRCLADGNELLRFHGTVVACSLGSGSLGPCGSDNCGVCRILKRGFPSKKEIGNSIGIFTASTSSQAIESIYIGKEAESFALRKALVVCRVIAGRVHKPVENLQDGGNINSSGFDSIAGKLGSFSSIEELYVLNPKALLPCFVVICRT